MLCIDLASGSTDDSYEHQRHGWPSARVHPSVPRIWPGCVPGGKVYCFHASCHLACNYCCKPSSCRQYVHGMYARVEDSLRQQLKVQRQTTG